jgi:hypothetical protein
MKIIKRYLLKFYTWAIWRQFLSGLKSVLGHKTLSMALKEMKSFELAIRQDNELKDEEKISWDNSRKTPREKFARYMTLKHFSEVGELLAFFRSVDKKKILEVN